MEIVDVDDLGREQYESLEGDEVDPWGAVANDIHMEWRRKDHHVAMRTRDGELVAAAGLVVADVEFGSDPPAPVVGIGGVLVAERHRGRGYGRAIITRAIERAGELGPASAMLFCLPDREPIYKAHGFVHVSGPVVVDQPDGPVEMPLVTMWRALAEEALAPQGRVRVRGLPF